MDDLLEEAKKLITEKLAHFKVLHANAENEAATIRERLAQVEKEYDAISHKVAWLGKSLEALEEAERGDG